MRELKMKMEKIKEKKTGRLQKEKGIIFLFFFFLLNIIYLFILWGLYLLGLLLTLLFYQN